MHWTKPCIIRQYPCLQMGAKVQLRSNQGNLVVASASDDQKAPRVWNRCCVLLGKTPGLIAFYLRDLHCCNVLWMEKNAFMM